MGFFGVSSASYKFVSLPILEDVQPLYIWIFFLLPHFSSLSVTPVITTAGFFVIVPQAPEALFFYFPVYLILLFTLTEFY
jgi:hypothetical protein